MHNHSFSLRSVKHLLKRAKELELSDGAVQRLKWFAYALEHDGNVSLTCRHFGIARTTYLRWVERFDPRHPSSLEEESRCPITVRTPETPPHVVAQIREIRLRSPLMGKEEISALLQREYGMRVSASTVGRTIARNGFFFAHTPAHERKRAELNIDIPLSQTDTDVSSDSSALSVLPPDPLAS